MKLPTVFHDALIQEMVAGPRKELTIILLTVNPPHPQERYRIRFGAIENYDSIVSVLEGIQEESDGGDYIGRIDQMQVLNDDAPAHELAEVAIQIDHWERFVLKCKKISISKANS